MPKIPEYIRRESIPAQAGNIMANAEAMSKPDLAFAAVGKKIGDEYTDLFAQMQAKVDAVEVLKSLNDFRNEQRNYLRETGNIVGKNVFDVSNFTQNEADKGKDLTTRGAEWHQGRAEAYAHNLSNDRQKDLFMNAARADIEQGLDRIANHQATQTRQYFVDQIAYTIDTAIKDIQDHPSEDVVNRAKLKVATAIQALYPGQNVDDYKLHALNRIDTATKAIRDEADVLSSYNILYKEHGGDAYKMRADLMNPETMKRLGLDARSVREVESLISDQEKTKGAIYEQTEAGYFKDLQGGKLKKSRIILDLDNGLIDTRGAEHWVKAITETTAGDDPQAVIMMHDNIGRGSIIEHGIPRTLTAQDVLRAPGISMKTKTTLLDKFYTTQSKGINEGEKQAKDLLRSQIISTSPLGSPLPAEHERLYKAYEGIDKYADEARKAGKPWTLKEYMEYARQLADFYRPTVESKVEDYRTMFGPRQPAAATQPGVTTAPAALPKRKPGENIKDYLKRTGRE